jgi:hypothetical protein
MTDPIKKARTIIKSRPGYEYLWEWADQAEDIARAALDCLEALRGPRFLCEKTGKEVGWLLGTVHKVLKDGVTIPCCMPPDLHAKAWEKFEDVEAYLPRLVQNKPKIDVWPEVIGE